MMISAIALAPAVGPSPDELSRLRRWGVALLALAVVVLMVGGSDLRLPFRPATRSAAQPGSPIAASALRPGDAGAAADQARRDGVDVAEVMDTVRHRVVADPSGTLVAEDDRYQAAFDADGFQVRPTGGDGAAVGDGVRLSTTAIVQGSTPVEIATGPWRGDANVAERPLGSGIVERVTATDGQVEWDVVVGSRPVGGGDLRIEADLAGASGPPHADADGLRWDLGGGQSVLMGALIVKDRTGTELYRTLPDADASRVTLLVPESALRGAAYPLTVDPTVSPEHPVAGPVAGAPAFEGQSSPQVAFDGTNHLVVWDDYRSGTNSDIYGARVSPSGTVLDPAGIPIATGDHGESRPAIAFDGTNFLVTWADSRAGFVSDIYGARVSPAGAVLDPGGFAITVGAGDDGSPDLAFDGTNYLVVWTASGGRVLGNRVSPAGTVLDGDGFPIASGAGEPAVAFDGSNLLVVWGSSGTGSDLFGTRVSPAGVVLGQFAVAAAPNAQSSADLAFDGTRYLVTWTDKRTDSAGDIYAARVSPAGSVLDPSGVAVSAAAGVVESLPAIAFDGTNHMVTWTDRRQSPNGDIYGARVSPAGAVLDPAGIPVHTSTGLEPAGSSAVSFGGTNHLVVWNDFATGTGDIDGARVSPTGSVVGPASFRVAISANAQITPAVAFDGTNYLVVWTDNRFGDTDIYGARVSPTGTVLDGTGIAIARFAGTFETDPAVDFDGTNFFVVWAHDQRSVNQGIRGARVTSGGVVLDPTGIAISSSGSSRETPALAFDGTNHLVVWHEQEGFRRSDVYGVRVGAAGTIVGVPTLVARGTVPSVAFDGTNFLVVVTGTGVLGYRVDQAGVAFGDPILISSGTGRPGGPASVAFDGTRYLVVWRAGDFGAHDILGARVSTTGAVLDPAGISISTAPGEQEEPQVAANGRFLVVWRDELAGPGACDVCGARVDGAGHVLDPAGFAIATGPDAATAPAVAAGPGDRFGVVYQRFTPEAPFGAPRSYLRTVAPK